MWLNDVYDWEMILIELRQVWTWHKWWKTQWISLFFTSIGKMQLIPWIDRCAKYVFTLVIKWGQFSYETS